MKFNLTRPKPCVFCGNKDIKEYMINEDFSFMACDKCNVSAPCGSSTFRAARQWNAIMTYFRKVKANGTTA